MIDPRMTDREQFAALNVLDYLNDLFTGAGKEQFTRAEVLIVFNEVRNDPDIFNPLVVEAQDIAAREIDEAFPLT